MASNSLFDNTAKTEPIITVSKLNLAVAKILEQNFPLAWISGEISNFTRATSGHWYFTLKDQDAQVRAVMFRGRAQYASFSPREGDKVEVRALVSLYTPRGDYQINVEAIRRAGLGSLYETFLRLKTQLESEGLFDEKKKKNIPMFVKRIGIITSPNAAALRDVLTALKRRAPHIEVYIYPTPVQGDGSAAKIAQTIASASADGCCDLLIVCRGGGSIEDLWAFNEEIVARTVAHCDIPIISGIGHETDFTITDFVADLRAPTPTAAAELAATPRQVWLTSLWEMGRHIQVQMQRQLQNQTQQLDWVSQRLVSPLVSIAGKRQSLHLAAQRLRFSLLSPSRGGSNRLRLLQQRLMQHRPPFSLMSAHIKSQEHTLQISMSQIIQQRRQGLQNLKKQLELLNPQRTLERGYVILSRTDITGGDTLITSGKDLQPQQRLLLRTAKDQTEIELGHIGKPQPT